MDYELWVYPVLEGVAIFDGMSVVRSTTVIPNREIAQTAPISSYDYSSNERAFGNALNEGGSFLSVLGNVVSALPVVGNVVKSLFGNQSQPVPVPQAFPVAPMMRPLRPRPIAPGRGRPGVAPRRIGRSVMGHALEGGQIATQSELGAVSRRY